MAQSTDHPRVMVRDLGRHVDETVTVDGWLYNRRSKGKIQDLGRQARGPAVEVLELAPISVSRFSPILKSQSEITPPAVHPGPLSEAPLGRRAKSRSERSEKPRGIHTTPYASASKTGSTASIRGRKNLA